MRKGAQITKLTTVNLSNIKFIIRRNNGPLKHYHDRQQQYKKIVQYACKSNWMHVYSKENVHIWNNNSINIK